MLLGHRRKILRAIAAPLRWPRARSPAKTSRGAAIAPSGGGGHRPVSPFAEEEVEAGHFNCRA